MTTDFSAETMQARTRWGPTLKVRKGRKKINPECHAQENMSLKTEG